MRVLDFEKEPIQSVKIAILNSLTDSNPILSFDTVSVKNLSTDMTKHVGCQPANLLSRLIYKSGSRRISVFFSLATTKPNDLVMALPQQIISENRGVSYEGASFTITANPRATFFARGQLTFFEEMYDHQNHTWQAVNCTEDKLKRVLAKLLGQNK